ncbi:MAG: aminotransferase class V-fold PLP-dependent enzyme [Gammaproteobacteria bacterium]|nr:aminotransferase class V-fold PLP-dependent enzyme [Gammaproteobacteria bacterium]
MKETNLEDYFQQFREQIIGLNLTHNDKTIVYADWTASGRLYQPIEEFILKNIAPWVANTHTEASYTGRTMTRYYHEAQQIIKAHVGANSQDVLICAGTGMTGVVNKFQRILGLRVPEKWAERFEISEDEKPVIFITHMEHHSNQTTWEECAATVVIIPENERGLPDANALDRLLHQYKDRSLKIGSFTACSNVTGIKIDYQQLAEMMHRHGGYCFVDFAASAPYVEINMHPENPLHQLDAIMFSPHKFLGGPGSNGVLIFNRNLYHNKVPDHPGGGTVTWTNPWGKHQFFEDIEIREDGGTPGFLQTIRTALAIRLKEKMGVDNIDAREKELVSLMFEHLQQIPQIEILHDTETHRLAVFSFYVPDIHFNLMVRLLSDKFGIESRGGCSCAGTYGHILLGVDQETSHEITCKIDEGDLSKKPGWIRVSLHPTTSNNEVLHIAEAIKQIIAHVDEWQKEYEFDPGVGDYVSKTEQDGRATLRDF